MLEKFKSVVETIKGNKVYLYGTIAAVAVIGFFVFKKLKRKRLSGRR